MSADNDNVSSPKATGGAGTVFEQHTDAAFLGWLLVGAIPPILTDCCITRLHVQTKHLGWGTDDLLVVGTNGTGDRQLACQVKSGLTIGSSDEECKKTFEGFWKDFQSGDRFHRDRDALALVIQHGTNALLKSFTSLLDQARASLDAADFIRRLSVKGLLPKKAIDQCKEIRLILDGAAGRAVLDEELWGLLSVLHVLSFDLNSSTAQTEASVKSLLAQTSTEADKLGSAQLTWGQLIQVAGKAMGDGADYTRDKLPTAVQQRHAAIGSGEHKALQALRDHSKLVLDGISIKIGKRVTLQREATLSSSLSLLESHRVLVITGPPGFGKSGIAKSILQSLEPHYFGLGFRAEEFATAHLDTTIKAITDISADNLFSLLGPQGRKLLLVESVERLLEANVRDGFADLLRMVLADDSWRLVLTCRDYSVEIVRSALLEHAALEHALVTVPSLDDSELAQVLKAIPALERPSNRPSLNALFRNPYILDKAAGMQWTDEHSYPTDERTFRQKLWKEIVRDDSHPSGGLPARREKAFIDVALRRARHLTSFVNCDDLDAEALQALRTHSLIAHPTHSLQFAAPGHDVLEDWALLAWFAITFEKVHRAPSELAKNIAGYPALRRSYRKWLGETLECTPTIGDTFILAACEDKDLPSQFRDDTLVSVLLSSSAKTFLERHRERFLLADALLLKRVIHLLRIAAVTKPLWLPVAAAPSAVMVPTGTAWEAVLAIVWDNVKELLPAHAALIAGLLTDWARGVSVWTPYPSGSDQAARIAFALLPHLEGRRAEELRTKVLSVIVKIPKADTTQFLELVKLAASFEPHPSDNEDIRSLLLDGVDSAFACRDFPDAIIGLAETAFCLAKDDTEAFEWSNGLDLEVHFGIRPGFKSDFFPASSWRGPFRLLLRWHPQKAMEFILRFVNHAIQWHAEGIYPNEHLEPLTKVTLEIPGHGTVAHWCNQRVWCFYRATTVGPPLLVSALMALEEWLLECSARPEFPLDKWLLHILKRANNGALTAVVASLCNAYPSRAGGAGIALLGSPSLIRLDRMRMAQERQSPSSISRFLPAVRSGEELHEGDRKTSDSLPHRQADLEHLARNLQLTAQRDEVWRIIDGYRSKLPDPSAQTEEDKLWRLVLHRMDIRHYEVASEEEATKLLSQVPDRPSEPGTESKEADPQKHVVLRGGPLDPDIQAFVDEGAAERSLFEAFLKLSNWATAQWEGRKPEQAGLWKDMLTQARTRSTEEEQVEIFAQGGPGLIAAVCVRDHWSEMFPEDQEWCRNSLIQHLDRDLDSTEQLVRVTRMFTIPSRPAAYVLPALLASSSKDTEPQLLQALAKALTHASTEVVQYAIEGVGHYLTKARTDFIHRYAHIVLSAAKTANALIKQNTRKQYEERRETIEIIREVAQGIRARLAEGGAIPPVGPAPELDQWPTREITRPLLQLLAGCPNLPEAHEIFGVVAKQVVAWWDLDRRSRDEGQRDYHFEGDCLAWLSRYVLAVSPETAIELCKPLIAAIERHPREIANFIWNLLLVEDQSDANTSFWPLWKAFAKGVKTARWVTRLDEEYATGSDLIYRMFLGLTWKKGVQHWRRLDACPECIDLWFEELPPSANVMESYCRFLYYVGSKSLPYAFIRLAGKLDRDGRMLAAKDTVYLLETILRRLVYSTPHALKEDASLRASILKILDALVEAGSSSAYRMRDDFVTPLPP